MSHEGKPLALAEPELPCPTINTPLVSPPCEPPRPPALEGAALPPCPERETGGSIKLFTF
jgi:hypothetical protein